MRAIQFPLTSVRPYLVPTAIYTRVSTLDQVGGRFDSCESQAAICRDFIQKHTAEGWYEAASFSDPAYSGGTMNRPGIQALMRQIEAGEIKVVVIFKLERVLRSTDEWAPFRAFLMKHGCRLVTPTEDHSDDSASGRLKTNLLVSVAEYERLNTAEKVRAKMVEQVKRGIWNTGQVPFGYSYDLESKKLSPDPAEAAIVRRIYEEAARLVSLTRLANDLNAEGLRTRVRVFRRRDGNRETVGGKPFRSDHLRKMIRSSIYLGRVRLHGDDYDGRHEALISRQLWERANAAVERALRPARAQLQARDKLGHLLKGLAFCAHCGRAMVPSASGKRNAACVPYRYYTCGRVQRESANSRCPVRHVSADALEKAVIGFIGSVGRRPEVVQAVLAANNQRREKDRRPLRARLSQLDKSLEQVARRIGNCAEAIAAGGAEVIGDELREKATVLKEEKQRLLVEREQVWQELAACDQVRFDAERIATSLVRLEEVLGQMTVPERKELLLLCLERVEISAATDVRVARDLELRVKLRATELVSAMEERVVVRLHGRHPAALTRRAVVFAGRVKVGRTAGMPSGASAAKVARTAQPERRAHPLQRALHWQKLIAAEPDLKRAALARRERVSGPTMTRYLQLLKLKSEIQKIVLALEAVNNGPRISLTRLVAIAHLPADEQRGRFEALQKKWMFR
ncbi:MAG: recombinase family protein [Opitutaceae bacterium]|nr:recombinase family protein [Opitutaceae bacterium]